MITMESLEKHTSNSNSGNVISKTKSRLQQKVDVVQQVVTILENVMSSAKDLHEQKQSHIQSKLDALNKEFNDLMLLKTQDEDQHKTITNTLESGIRKYIALENILITAQEGTQNDNNIFLADISSADKLVDQYLREKNDNWQHLKLECEKLNHSTKMQPQPQQNVGIRRYRLSVWVEDLSKTHPQKTHAAANFLNSYRGKKTSGATFVHDIALTWFQNEQSAARYVQCHFHQIISDTVGKEYAGQKFSIKEVTPEDNDVVDPSWLLHTVHVQPKASSPSSLLNAPITPRQITIYQFDDTHFRSTDVTTFNMEDASVDNNRNSSQEIEYLETVVSAPPVSSRDANQSNTPQQKPQTPKRKPKPKRFVTPEDKRISNDTTSISIHDSLQTSSVVSCSTSENKTSLNTTPVKKKSKPMPKSLKIAAALKESAKSSVVKNAENTEANTVFDGVELQTWVSMHGQKLGIVNLTPVQKEMLNRFSASNDIHYNGVANSGKTTCSLLAVMNRINLSVFKTQAIFMTSNSRSSKLIQKMITTGGDSHAIISVRTDALIEARKTCKTDKYSVCQILIGSCEQVLDTIHKNFIRYDEVEYLVIDNADEMFAMGKKSIIYKILYTLPATIKVVVISHTSTNTSNDLNTFCKTKLRNPVTIEEDMDMDKFLQCKKRKPSSDEYLVTSGKPDEIPSGSSSMDQTNKTTRNNDNLATITSSTEDFPESHFEDENFETESSYDTIDDQMECVDGTVTITMSEDKFFESKNWKTLIPQESLAYLGIDQPDLRLNPSDLSHLYANIEGDEFKVEIISQLDIEEDKTIIFCNSIDTVEWLSTRLRQLQLLPHVVHEEIPRQEQLTILRNFRVGSLFCRVLIATDFLASISLDAADVVLNFDIPETTSIYESRTAYATRNILSQPDSASSNKGIVVTFINEGQYDTIRDLEEKLGITIQCAYQ